MVSHGAGKGGGRRPWLVVGLVAAIGVLVASVGLLATRGGGTGAAGWHGLMGSGGSSVGMGQRWLAGNGTPVASIAAARSRAARASASQGLHPGEVMWYDNGFYVELKDAAGRAQTEVIVDPTSGAVTTEPGPAMMWSTRSGMGRMGTGNASVTQVRARQIATGWLAANRPGATANAGDSYPGYYTFDFGRNGAMSEMLSVNASSGAVWFHSWHGRFISMEDS